MTLNLWLKAFMVIQHEILNLSIKAFMVIHHEISVHFMGQKATCIILLQIDFLINHHLHLMIVIMVMGVHLMD